MWSLSVEDEEVTRSAVGKLLAVLIFFDVTLSSVLGSLASSCSTDACARLGAPRVGDGDLEKGSGAT